MGSAGRMLLSFHFPLPYSKQTRFYDLREGRVGSKVFLCQREKGLEENQNPGRRGTDSEANAVAQIRSKKSLN